MNGDFNIPVKPTTIAPTDSAAGLRQAFASAQLLDKMHSVTGARSTQPVLPGSAPVAADTTSEFSQAQTKPVGGSVSLADVKAPNPSKASILETVDIANLTYAELQQLQSEVVAAALAIRRAELQALVDGALSKAAELGISEREFLVRVKARSKHNGLTGGATRPRSGTGNSVDRTGHKPVVGVRYKNPNTGAEWTKPRSQGAAKQEFIALIQSGFTWDQLKITS